MKKIFLGAFAFMLCGALFAQYLPDQPTLNQYEQRLAGATYVLYNAAGNELVRIVMDNNKEGHIYVQGIAEYSGTWSAEAGTIHFIFIGLKYYRDNVQRYIQSGEFEGNYWLEGNTFTLEYVTIPDSMNNLGLTGRNIYTVVR